MMKNQKYWLDTNHENDEVSMNEMVTDSMLALQEMKTKFRKIYRQTYAGVTMQAKRRNTTSQNISHSLLEQT